MCLCLFLQENLHLPVMFEKNVWKKKKMSETILTETILSTTFLSETIYKCLKLIENVWNYFNWNYFVWN
jgi:hypothetical protein